MAYHTRTKAAILLSVGTSLLSLSLLPGTALGSCYGNDTTTISPTCTCSVANDQDDGDSDGTSSITTDADDSTPTNIPSPPQLSFDGVNLPTVTLSGSSSDHVPGAASTEQRVQAPPVKTVLSELMMRWSQY
ncbi:hypothetical protein BT96DRAFT_935784 [Gymnopus androsaceus JB14]|uniref:Secreted protein n=1 Tax=Gymnopus androsaceus JB14 TaxID=1447944 RepID=A0A6A4I623_9AGAR|nr:hypothetical protein BT96DRAFT_935784 [Gymnopus androsaceus JB14]